MAITININDLTLCHKGSGGVAIATLPDVCKTPPGPVPVPYPNIAFSKQLKKGTKTIKVDGGHMAAHKASEFSRSIGDEPGVAKGIKSNTHMKEATWITYSVDVKLEGKNACRLTDKMLMNHGNTVCLGGETQDFLKTLRDFGELALLCEIFCHCNGKGNQDCVKNTLNEFNEDFGGNSNMIPEMPYNMLESPPEPMVSTHDHHRPSTHWYFPNHPHRKKLDSKGYEPGTGDVVRPDVILLDDPNGKAKSTNLRAVVEMKFPNDPNDWDSDNMQMREIQYLRIAQENNPNAPYIRMDKKTCPCSDDDNKERRPVYEPIYGEITLPERKWQLQQQSEPISSGFSLGEFGLGLLETTLGTAEMLGGILVTAGSSALTAELVVDDMTGIGTLNDPLIPVAAAGVGSGVMLIQDGHQRSASGLTKLWNAFDF